MASVFKESTRNPLVKLMLGLFCLGVAARIVLQISGVGRSWLGVLEIAPFAFLIGASLIYARDLMRGPGS